MSLNVVAVNQRTGVSQGVTELPPELIAGGNPVSETFLTSKFHSEGEFEAGVWAGEPGKIKISNYPYDEVFTVTKGRIDLINDDGSVVVVGVGHSVLMRKGWNGIFHVVEPSEKCFASIG